MDIQNQSKLVFNRYGSQYFLSQVWIAGHRDGEQLRKTGQERGLQRELAKLGSKPEVITIASRSK